MTATEDWLKSIGKTNGAKTALALSVDERKPDDLAEHARIGQQLGLPPVVVGSDPAAFKARADQKRIADLLATSPKTAAWLSDRANGGLAKDDVENLSWFERNTTHSGGPLTRAFSRGVVSLGGAIPTIQYERAAARVADFSKTEDDFFNEIMAPYREGAGGTHFGLDISTLEEMARNTAKQKFEQISRLTEKEKAALVLRGAQALTDARSASERAASVPMSDMNKAYQDGPLARAREDGTLMGFIRSVGEDPTGAMAFFAETAAESLPLMVGAAGVTAATRSPALGITAMAGGSYLQENNSAAMDLLKEKGIDLSTPEAALAALQDADLMAEVSKRGMTKGFVVGLFDAVSGGIAGKTLVKSGAGDAIVQGVAQAVLGAGGEAAGQLVSGQKFSLVDVLVEGLSELATAPIEVGGVAGRGLIRQFSRNAKTGTTAQTLADADAKVQESKLRARDPAKFEDAMANATPGQFIYVPSEDLNTFFQAKDTGFDPAAWGIDPADFAEQTAAGGNIAIPMATYLAKISGTPDAVWFHENSSFSDDEMSIAEAKKFNSEVRDVIERSLQEADRARIADLESRASDVQVKDNLYSQLRAAGNTADAAEKMAAAQTAFIRTMASRVGEDSLDLSRRFGLVIEGPETNDFRRRGDLDIALNTIRSGRMPKPKGASLSEFIAAKGGVRDTGGDLEAMGAPKELIAQTRAESLERAASPSMLGMSEVGKGDTLDNLARAAVEAGYFPDLMGEVMGNDGPEADLAAVVMEALREEFAGRKTYVPGEGVDPALQNLADEISRLGMDISASNDEIAAALQGDGLSQDPFAVDGWQDAEVSVQADDGKAVKMKAGEVEAIIQERLSAARALLECMNG